MDGLVSIKGGLQRCRIKGLRMNNRWRANSGVGRDGARGDASKACQELLLRLNGKHSVDAAIQLGADAADKHQMQATGYLDVNKPVDGRVYLAGAAVAFF